VPACVPVAVVWKFQAACKVAVLPVSAFTMIDWLNGHAVDAGLTGDSVSGATRTAPLDDLHCKRYWSVEDRSGGRHPFTAKLKFAGANALLRMIEVLMLETVEVRASLTTNAAAYCDVGVGVAEVVADRALDGEAVTKAVGDTEADLLGLTLLVALRGERVDVMDAVMEALIVDVPVLTAVRDGDAPALVEGVTAADALDVTVDEVLGTGLLVAVTLGVNDGDGETAADCEPLVLGVIAGEVDCVPVRLLLCVADRDCDCVPDPVTVPL
jgi:hypothetical protein